MMRGVAIFICTLLMSVGVIYTRRTPHFWEFLKDLKMMNKKLTVLRSSNVDKHVTSITTVSSAEFSSLAHVLSQKRAEFQLNTDSNNGSDSNSTTLITTTVGGVEETDLTSQTIWDNKDIKLGSGAVSPTVSSPVTQDVKSTSQVSQIRTLHHRQLQLDNTELTIAETEMSSTISWSKAERSMYKPNWRAETTMSLVPTVNSKLSLHDLTRRTTYDPNALPKIVNVPQSNKNNQIMLICLVLSACIIFMMMGILIFIVFRGKLKAQTKMHAKKKISLNVLTLESVGVLPTNREIVKELQHFSPVVY